VVTRAELLRRALAARLVLTDCDGVLTDAGVYYADSGETWRRFSVRDGMGVERLRAAGIATGIVTRERAASIERRAAKLGLPHVYLGVQDKHAHLAQVLRDSGLSPAELAYIGDDLNDLGLLTTIGAHGLTAAPASAMPEVAVAVHYRCRLPGGHGAFREFAEWILALRRTRGED
jgi:3-deoxy-D-manno-octulosonate 8-phosphate phosphatase (KDO 8-P phosphatase)